jgi:hypothetical protein
MRRLLIATTAVALLVLVGCGSEATTAGDASSTTTSTTASTATGSPGTASASPDSSADPGDESSSGCVAVAEDAAPDIATRSFPDNPDEIWTVDGVTENDDGQVVVEVVPASAAVGYPRFRFVTVCEGEEAVLLATYALEEGSWVLLFTSDAAEGIDFDPELAD